MKFIGIISFLVALFFCQAAMAQPIPDTVDLLQEVTVSATKNALPVAQLPYAVVVLKKAALASPQSRTVPEALFGITGLFIQKTNHGGGSPFLRGLTGNQSLVIVDGVRLNNSIFRYGPNQYMTLIDPAIIDRIEVVKGTGSVQYGSDAMTGVISVQTRTPQFNPKPVWKGQTAIRWTSAGMENTIHPEIQYASKRFAVVAGGGLNRFGDLLGGDTTGFQRPSGYRQGSMDISLRFDLGKRWILTGSSQWLQQRNVPVYHKYVLENYALQDADPMQRMFSYVKLNKAYHTGLLRGIDIVISSQYMGETRYSRKQGAALTRKEFDRVTTNGFCADFAFQFNPFWKSNTGWEMYYDKVGSQRYDLDPTGFAINSLRGLYPNRARYYHTSFYSLHHFQLNRLQIEAGLRQTFYRVSITDSTLGKVEYSPQALVAQAGFNYRLSPSFYAYAHISEGFRAVNIDDMGTLGIVDFRYEVPAYDLKPEQSLNQELGIKMTFPKLTATVSVFRTQLSNLISRIKTPVTIAGYDVYKKVNVDQGFITGYEAEVHYQPFTCWGLHAGVAYLYGRSSTRNEPLRRIPPLYSRTTLHFTKGKYKGMLHVDHAASQTRLAFGDLSDNRIPKGGTPGFTIIHAEAGIDFRRINLRVYLHNLFNADYRLHGSGINGMGRAVSINLMLYFFDK